MRRAIIAILVFILIPLRVAFADPDSSCIAIDILEIDGSTQLSQATKLKLQDSLDISCVTSSKIEDLVKATKSEYEKVQIPLVKVKLPEQNLRESHKLIIEIIEPIIDDIAFTENSPCTNSQIYFSFPTQKGDVLKFDNLLQGISQFNRLDTTKTTLNLKQTDIASNKYVVELTQIRDLPVTASIGYDNEGTPSSGIYRKTLSLNYDNLLNINDRLEAIYRKNSLSEHQTKLTETFYGKYDIPFGNWNFGPSIERTATSFLLQLTYFFPSN